MKPCVVFLHIPPLVWVVHTRKRCGFWICANKSDARYTTGQPQPSVDRCVCFLLFVQRSISDLCQLGYPQSLNNPTSGNVPERIFLPPMRILLSDGGFGKNCHRVFQFCRHKPSNATVELWECSCSDGISLEKRRHFLIPCRRKHPKTPAFAQRFPATAGTAPKQAEKKLYFQPLSVLPEASAGICP